MTFESYDERHAYLVKALREEGYGNIQIEGLMIALAGETRGLDPTDMERPRRSGFTSGVGLPQWTWGRRRDFEAAVRRAKVQWTDFPFQVSYLIGELAGKGNHWTGFMRGRRGFMTASSSDEAAAVVVGAFLRPSYAYVNGTSKSKRIDPKRVARIVQGRKNSYQSQKRRQPTVRFTEARLAANPNFQQKGPVLAMNRSRPTSIPQVTTKVLPAPKSLVESRTAAGRAVTKQFQQVANLIYGARLTVDGLWGPNTAKAAARLGIKPAGVPSFTSNVIGAMRRTASVESRRSVNTA